MINHCTLCASANIEFALRFPDVNGDLVEFYMCMQCGSLIPQFGLHNPGEVVGQQVRFHEDWWRDSLAEELDRNLRSMASVVSLLQPVLGSPQNGEGAVVEVGCGRGTMLRALTDAGYSAIGCEPSAKLSKIARDHYRIPAGVLFEMTADEFLDGPVSCLPQAPRAVILWHVLEHLADPIFHLSRIHDVLPCGGYLILQLPLLHQPYVYPEHYFFVNDRSLYYLADRCGFSVVSLECDHDYFYITACLKKCVPAPSSVSDSIELTNHFSAIGKAILLRDRSISHKRTLVEERMSIINKMSDEISNRDKVIAGQATLVEERMSIINKMSDEISNRDKVIAGQAVSLEEIGVKYSKIQNHPVMGIMLGLFRIK